MPNKNCPYRTKCPQVNSCYERTNKEETWCFLAKVFWDNEHQEEDRDYWKEPVFEKVGGS